MGYKRLVSLLQNLRSVYKKYLLGEGKEVTKTLTYTQKYINSTARYPQIQTCRHGNAENECSECASWAPRSYHMRWDD